MSSWEETHWIDSDGSKVTIHDVLRHLKDEPIIEVEISTIQRNADVPIDLERKSKADLGKFILLHNNVLLDGYHRVARAVESGITHLPAKKLKGDLFALVPRLTESI